MRGSRVSRRCRRCGCSDSSSRATAYYPQSRVLEIAHRLRADRIPADAIYLDIDFQDKNFPFTVDCKKFPDFLECWPSSKRITFMW